MHRKRIIGISVVLLAGLLPAWAGSALSVQVRSTQVRGTPSFLGKIVASLQYGDQVDTIKDQGAWINVRLSNGKTGWVNESAVSTRKVTMRAGTDDVQTGATGDELALAGKGFSSAVEDAFKAENKDIDFAPVDRMEKVTVSVRASTTFLKDGRVTPKEGAR